MKRRAAGVAEVRFITARGSSRKWVEIMSSPSSSRYRRLLAVAVLLLCNAVQGDSRTLRCGNKLVELGDSADTVRKICGAPGSVEYDSKTFRNGGSLGGVCFHGTVPIERWTYQRGATRFAAILTLADGKLLRISFAAVDPQPEIWSLGCKF